MSAHKITRKQSTTELREMARRANNHVAVFGVWPPPPHIDRPRDPTCEPHIAAWSPDRALAALAVIEAAQAISGPRHTEPDGHAAWCSAGGDDLLNCPVCGHWVALDRAIKAWDQNDEG